MKIAIVCILLVFAVSYVSSTCSRGKPSLQIHKWSKKVTTYCEYKGMKLKVNSQFTDYNTCQRCSCSASGLECCGIGYYAGVMHIEGCAIVPDFCDVAILNKGKTALCHP